MTSAATETRSSDAPRGSRRVHIDLIGLAALTIAVVGVTVTIAVLLAPAAERDTPQDIPALVAPPARDQWYLDQSVQAPAAPPLASQARDRWYLDGRPASDMPKDRWYSDPPYRAR